MTFTRQPKSKQTNLSLTDKMCKLSQIVARIRYKTIQSDRSTLQHILNALKQNRKAQSCEVVHHAVYSISLPLQLF